MPDTLRPSRTSTYEHTVSGLLTKRAELFGEAERIRDRLAEIKNDGAAMDRVLGTLGYAGDLDAAMLRQKREVIFGPGELTRGCVDALRDAGGPLTSRQVAETLLSVSGQDARDSRLLGEHVKGVSKALRMLKVEGRIMTNRGRPLGRPSHFRPLRSPSGFSSGGVAKQAIPGWTRSCHSSQGPFTSQSLTLQRSAASRGVHQAFGGASMKLALRVPLLASTLVALCAALPLSSTGAVALPAAAGHPPALPPPAPMPAPTPAPVAQNPLTDPNNPANPNSPLNINNPANPASLNNPNNPANPNSPLNPSNQPYSGENIANPYSTYNLQHPESPNSALNINNPHNPASLNNPNNPANPNSPFNAANQRHADENEPESKRHRLDINYKDGFGGLFDYLGGGHPVVVYGRDGIERECRLRVDCPRSVYVEGGFPVPDHVAMEPENAPGSVPHREAHRRYRSVSHHGAHRRHRSEG